MELLSIIAAVVAAAGALPYILAILRGTARPRIVSWAVWTILAGIMTVSAFMEGQQASAVLSLSTFVSCFMIMVLGWRQGRVSLDRLDVLCMLGAAAGIMALVVLRDPVVALTVAVAVDAVAFVPTLWHAWTDPHEESLTCFVLAALGGGIAVAAAALSNATFAGLLYPVYAVAFNGIMALLLMIGRLGPMVSMRQRSEEG